MTLALWGLVVLAVLLWPHGGSEGQIAGSRRQGDDLDETSSPGIGPGESADRPLLGEVADAADLLALALGAGGSVAGTLDAVARVSGAAVAADLRRVSAALRWGRSMRAAWDYASPGWAPVATALVVASECGAPAAEVLAGAARRIREEEERRLEAESARAGVLLVLPLGAFFLPAFLAVSVVPVVVLLLGQSLR